tara:strand:- start:259 stop:903 length:645 start_codon:yes stop_codon:yes gene_type:complete
MAFQYLSVGEIAVILPGATAVFRRHKIDFSCGGEALITKAAERHGLDLIALEAELHSLSTPGVHAPAETADLIAHIIERYHKAHRLKLNAAIRDAGRVETEHQTRADCPLGLSELLSRIFSGLKEHQHKEEAFLFIAMLNGAGQSLRQSIACRMQEHKTLCGLLSDMADLTNNYTPPVAVCNTWHSLYVSCSDLDAELREQIHLENNILFRRFL